MNNSLAIKIGSTPLQGMMAGGGSIYVSLNGSGVESGISPSNSMPLADFVNYTIPSGYTVYFNKGDEFNI